MEDLEAKYLKGTKFDASIFGGSSSRLNDLLGGTQGINPFASVLGSSRPL